MQHKTPIYGPPSKSGFGEGWGVSDEMEISALMVAAALEKEARTQDECVKSGESAAEYPKRLRRWPFRWRRAAFAAYDEATHE